VSTRVEATTWRARSADPNSPACLAARRRQLASAWAEETRDRFSVIVELCRGRKVLDVGCVNHDPAAIDDPGWLHARITAVAAAAVGVDVEAEGVRRMRAAGFDVICASVSSGSGSLRSRAPFDVVVAGEVVEHLASPMSLLELARDVLRPGGVAVLTTPNPYALGRVRAGRLRVVWENVDHVTYLFPSGVAELADRTGLVLRTATTVGIDTPVTALKLSCKALARAVARRVPLPPNYVSPLDVVVHRCLSRVGRNGSQLGETAIYVLEKP
jgi:SAM-dependent methyltransferase